MQTFFPLSLTTRKQLKTVVSAFSKFIVLALFVLLAPLAVYLDTHALQHGVPENGITEWTQEALLLLSAIVFFVLAWSRPALRGFAVLVGGFFGLMLIRELDSVFDAIAHGFWIYPAGLWSATTLALAIRYRRGLLAAMAQAAESRAFIYIIVGLAIVLSFSRVFGTTAVWLAVLNEYDSARLAKTAVQEGLELLGYLLIFSGSLGYARQIVQQHARAGARQAVATGLPIIQLLREIAPKHQLDLSPALEKELAKKLDRMAKEQVAKPATSEAA